MFFTVLPSISYSCIILFATSLSLLRVLVCFFFFFFFFNDTATTEIYTLSLHDALPIWRRRCRCRSPVPPCGGPAPGARRHSRDRKSTRLNSSHDQISYAVFCLKKKKKTLNTIKALRSQASRFSIQQPRQPAH